MPRFECLNKDCSKYKEEVYFQKITYNFDKIKKELIPSQNLICKNCGGKLSFKKKEGFPQILKFDSLSDNEKKKIIHERAQNHFNKVGKEQKNYIKQQVIKRNLGL